MITDSMPKVVIEIEDIIVGERGRKEFINVDELAKSIKENGLMAPVGVKKEDGKYRLIYGERRLRATRSLEETTICAIIWPEDVSELQLRVLELEENLQRENLDWREETAMAEEVQRLRSEIAGRTVTQEEVANDLGVSQAKVSRDILLAKAVKASPEIAKCKTKVDAIKLLNKTKEKVIERELAKKVNARVAKDGDAAAKKRLMKSYVVGDFFDMVKKLPDTSFDFCEVDPPYGIDYKKYLEGRGSTNVENYHEGEGSLYPEFITETFKELHRVLRNNHWGICWCSVWDLNATAKAAIDAGFSCTGSPLLWIKAHKMGRVRSPESVFTADYETLIYFRKGQAKLNKQGPSSVFSGYPVKDKRHPTEKPVALIQDIMKNFCVAGDNILIPFAGSGNSFIAAHQLSLTPLGFDLSQEYKDSYTNAIEKYFEEGSA